MADFPIADRSAGDAHDRVEHVPLTDVERGNEHVLVPILRHTSTSIVRVIRQDFQTQQISNSATTLGPSASIDAGVAVVEERDGAIRNVEAVAVRTGPEAVFVPETARDADPGAPAEPLDERGVPGVVFAEGDVLEEARVGLVVAPLVGKDPRHVGGGGGLDELLLLLRRRSGPHGDDESVLALQRFDQAGWVVVVDFSDRGSGWHGARAVGACDSGDLVPAGLEQRLYDELADSTAGLLRE